MYHRIIDSSIHIGLGNPNKCILKNQWSENLNINNLVKDMLKEAIDLWFKDLQGCDFNIYQDEYCIEISFGIEPTYKYDKLKLIIINNNIKYSSYINGISFGWYGTNIIKTKKRYEEYKLNCKFKKFADKWSKELQKIFEESKFVEKQGEE